LVLYSKTPNSLQGIAMVLLIARCQTLKDIRMKKHSKLLSLTTVGICVLLGTFLNATGQTQPQDPSTITPEKRHATHGKLFPVYWRETIPELLSSRSGDLHLEDNKSPGFVSQPLNTPAYPPYAL